MGGKKVVRILKRKSSIPTSDVHKAQSPLKKKKMDTTTNNTLFQTCMDPSLFETSDSEDDEKKTTVHEIDGKIDLISDTKEANFRYLTKNPVLKEYELEVREKLVSIHDEVARCSSDINYAFQTTSCMFTNDFLDMTLADVNEMYGNPGTFDELLERILDEDEEEESVEASAIVTPSPPKRNPPKTAKRVMPKHKIGPAKEEPNVFEFGKHEIPREMREGEIVYSENKSPILLRHSQNSQSSNVENKTPERAENVARIALYDGKNKIEVDVILKDGVDLTGAGKNVFDNFISDIKKLPATVQGQRSRPPRIIKAPNTAIKKQPQ